MVFLASEKPFFFNYQVFQAVKMVSLKGNFCLMNSSFQLLEANFMSSRCSIALFRALLKILKFEGRFNLFKRNLISADGN